MKGSCACFGSTSPWAHAAAVQEFVETSDLARVLRVQRDIVGMYRQNIAKYAADKAHVHMIFDALPAELDKKNKRFKLSDLAKSARMERYASDFMWLVDAGVALPCYNAVAPQAPLAVNARHNLFKLFLCDVGLLSAVSVGAVQFDLVQGDVSVNWGSFLENALAQELAVTGSTCSTTTRARSARSISSSRRGRASSPSRRSRGSTTPCTWRSIT